MLGKVTACVLPVTNEGLVYKCPSTILTYELVAKRVKSALIASATNYKQIPMVLQHAAAATTAAASKLCTWACAYQYCDCRNHTMCAQMTVYVE
jgi:hypothetical protein